MDEVLAGSLDMHAQREIRDTPEERLGRANLERYRKLHDDGALRRPEEPARLIAYLAARRPVGTGVVLDISTFAVPAAW